MMAEVAEVSVSAVQRIWRAHDLQPHRVRQFKLSTDPQFAAKVRDIVGLYIDPRAHVIVLSVDRTGPPLPQRQARLGAIERLSLRFFIRGDVQLSRTPEKHLRRSFT